MKGFYTKLKNGYGQIEQTLEIPRNNITYKIDNIPNDYVTKVVHERNNGNEVDIKVSLNKVIGSDLNSNKDEYDAMIEFLTENKVKEIPTLIDKYIVIAEYMLTSVDMTEIYDQGVSVQYPKVEDYIYPLGASEDNDLLYRQLKRIKTDFHFLNKTKLSLGAIKKFDKEFLFIITGISVYQMVKDDSNVTEEIYHANIHSSMVDISFALPPTTITKIIETCEKVYSIEDEKIELASTYMRTLPSKLHLDLVIGLNDLIIGYDDNEVKKILEDNNKIVIPPVVKPDDKDTTENPDNTTDKDHTDSSETNVDKKEEQLDSNGE